MKKHKLKAYIQYAHGNFRGYIRYNKTNQDDINTHKNCMLD